MIIEMRHFFSILSLAIFIFFNVNAVLFAKTTTTSSNTSKEIRFITISDIHFDPYLSCKNATPCPLIKKLRNASPDQWENLLTEYDTNAPKYLQDSNYILLASLLSAARQAADTSHAKFVLILGDFLGHQFRKHYKDYSGDKTVGGYYSFVHKTLAFLTNQLIKTFPSTDVYAVVGNNDSYQGNYVTNADSQFFKDTAVLWSTLIKNKPDQRVMQGMFARAGYYSVLLSSQPSIRLIVLNSNIFSYKAKGKNIDTIANQELMWLHAQLKVAKENKQKVLIAMHIPEGIDIYATLRMRLFRLVTLWKPKYIQQFQAEIEQFAPQIAGIFAGHLHTDWFQILTLKNAEEVPMIGVPSVSPIFGSNPGFKIYSYSLDPFQLNDFVTYYYPLDGKREWKLAYGFNKISSHLSL
ncbi:MAG: metallophosphoesterase [Gammaproteobacteria bacterium]|nr:metallophosphoesterase [Gammaproteobacteria bacterium]MCW5582772.1 metallophosphoesterase [Gammaproteobacteria bacterium]